LRGADPFPFWITALVGVEGFVVVSDEVVEVDLASVPEALGSLPEDLLSVFVAQPQAPLAHPLPLDFVALIIFFFAKIIPVAFGNKSKF